MPKPEFLKELDNWKSDARQVARALFDRTQDVAVEGYKVTLKDFDDLSANQKQFILDAIAQSRITNVLDIIEHEYEPKPGSAVAKNFKVEDGEVTGEVEAYFTTPLTEEEQEQAEHSIKLVEHCFSNPPKDK